MRKDYEKLFTYITSPVPPKDLFSKIISNIELSKRKRVLIKRVAVFSVSLLGSLAALVPAVLILRTNFTESGFYQYFSLMFSDFGTIISYWQDYFTSLLESLPVFSLIFLLLSILWFISSLEYLAKNIKFLTTV